MVGWVVVGVKVGERKEDGDWRMRRREMMGKEMSFIRRQDICSGGGRGR